MARQNKLNNVLVLEIGFKLDFECSLWRKTDAFPVYNNNNKMAHKNDTFIGRFLFTCILFNNFKFLSDFLNIF